MTAKVQPTYIPDRIRSEMLKTEKEIRSGSATSFYVFGKRGRNVPVMLVTIAQSHDGSYFKMRQQVVAKRKNE